MRALILIAAAVALPLAACGNNDQTDNTANVDENLTAENIVSNDVTAIDAVTGDASNMAAESEINDIGAAPLVENGNAAAPEKPAKTAPKKPAASSKPATGSTPTSTPPATTTNSAE
jgi:hypothetical protein